MSGVLGHPDIRLNAWATEDDCGVLIDFGSGLRVVLAPFEARHLAKRLLDEALAAETTPHVAPATDVQAPRSA